MQYLIKKATLESKHIVAGARGLMQLMPFTAKKVAEI